VGRCGHGGTGFLLPVGGGSKLLPSGAGTTELLQAEPLLGRNFPLQLPGPESTREEDKAGRRRGSGHRLPECRGSWTEMY